VVTDTARGDEPVGVFSGDTLFVGDVGRPDLFPSIARELAAKLFDSLHAKILKLSDFCELYPAHGAGSLCGRAMGAKWRSTIGYERKFNQALQIRDREEFIKSLTTDMPPAPDHFSRCNDINRRGPALLESLPALRGMKPGAFRDVLQRTGAVVVDTRSYDAFGSQHVPDAWNIDLGGNFPTFAGWVLPTDKDIMLVSNSPEEAARAAVWARRVGVDRIIGYLDGGMIAWAAAGLLTRHVKQISAEELHGRVTGSSDIVLVDVRAPLEYLDNHIKGAVNIPVADLRTRYAELDPGKPTVLICSSGNRSSLAASILQQHNFKEVHNVAGGMTGYSAAGYAKQCAVCENPHGSRFFAIYLPPGTVES
jgi:rhodanese-related sulfurtransferase